MKVPKQEADDEPPALIRGQMHPCTRCGIMTKVRGHYMSPGNMQTWCCCDNCDKEIARKTKCIWPVDSALNGHDV